jgi:hemerythrin-like metal-binding protein
MAYLDWKEELSVGVSEMDEQHKKWIAITNELHDAMRAGKTNAVMSEILKKMSDYIAFHFSAEEILLKSKNYPDFHGHKRIHDQYAAKAREMVEQFMSGKVLMSLQVMDSLRDWLTSHIMVQDKKYGTFITKK